MRELKAKRCACSMALAGEMGLDLSLKAQVGFDSME